MWEQQCLLYWSFNICKKLRFYLNVRRFLFFFFETHIFVRLASCIYVCRYPPSSLESCSACGSWYLGKTSQYCSKLYIAIEIRSVILKLTSKKWYFLAVIMFWTGKIKYKCFLSLHMSFFFQIQRFYVSASRLSPKIGKGATMLESLGTSAIQIFIMNLNSFSKQMFIMNLNPISFLTSTKLI